MSYDLTALRLAPGEDLAEALERRELELEQDDDRAPTQEERAAMGALADALHAVEPSARRDEAPAWIELTGRFTQVGIYDDEVGISIPYHFDGRGAQDALARAHAYAAVLRERGWTVWDPQVEQVVGDAVPRGARGTYGVGRAAIARVQEEAAPGRRWWRRLGGGGR